MVQNIFQIETDNNSNISMLCCKNCENFPNTKDFCIRIQNANYNYYNNHGFQPNWFVTMITSLLKHIEKETHIKM